MNEPETRYAKTIDGVHIAYQVRGDGPVDLVYVTGFARTSRSNRGASRGTILWIGSHRSRA